MHVTCLVPRPFWKSFSERGLGTRLDSNMVINAIWYNLVALDIKKWLHIKQYERTHTHTHIWRRSSSVTGIGLFFKAVYASELGKQQISHSCPKAYSQEEPAIVCHRNQHEKKAQPNLDHMEKTLEEMQEDQAQKVLPRSHFDIKWGPVGTCIGVCCM